MRTLLCIAVYSAVAKLTAQSPLAVDPSFQLAGMDAFNINDIECLPDGKVVVSGLLHKPGEMSDYTVYRLLPDGSIDTTFNRWGGGAGGRIHPWNDQYYVQAQQGIARLDTNGSRDFSFLPGASPFFAFGQGGDSYVYPDGRVLFSGLMSIYDADTNFAGLAALVRFMTDGLLDPSFPPRFADGPVYHIAPLSSGKFLLNGPLDEYDGHPVDGLFRVHADGSMDTTFSFPYESYSEIWQVLELADGKLLLAGSALPPGATDTMNLVRIHPDGAIDTTFNNHLQFTSPHPLGAFHGHIYEVLPVNSDRYLLAGLFQTVEGAPRLGFCMIDTAGNLLNDYAFGTGCDTIYTILSNIAGLQGIEQAPDGSYYIHGGYKGFDDSYNNYPNQMMVTRLFGGNVGVEEQEQQAAALHVWPNPASALVQVESPTTDKLQWRLLDALGRQVPLSITVRSNATLDLSNLPPGVYLITATSTHATWAARLLKE